MDITNKLCNERKLDAALLRTNLNFNILINNGEAHNEQKVAISKMNIIS